MHTDFDIIVIGSGLVGAAAGKYLSAGSTRVAIVGAEQPSDQTLPLVYSSHNDEARIQRLVGKDENWTRLNIDSVKQYKNISDETGISFHRDVGCFYINPYGTDSYLEQFPYLAKRFDIRHRFCKSTEILEPFHSRIHFPETSFGVLEYGPSGYINPLRLIDAQLLLFKKQGGILFTDTVTRLIHQKDFFLLETANGNRLRSKQVLLATGSFLNQLDLLPMKLNLVTKSEVVLLIEANEQQIADYAVLPTILYEINEGDTEGIYILQPVRYPDGNYYFKIGCNLPGDLYFGSLEQIHHWFRVFDSNVFASILLSAFQKLFPFIHPSRYLTKKCIISRTEHGRPYIGETSQSGLFVAGGCNGYSAMCSDGIGQVAAQLIQTGRFPDGYNKEAFELRYQ